MFSLGKYSSKNTDWFSEVAQIRFWLHIWALCHLCCFNGTQGQCERTQAKENGLLKGDVVRIETSLKMAI